MHEVSEDDEEDASRAKQVGELFVEPNPVLDSDVHASVHTGLSETRATGEGMKAYRIWTTSN